MMTYCTELPVFSFLDIDGGKKRGIFCDSNCIFTFLVLIYSIFNVFLSEIAAKIFCIWKCFHMGRWLLQ